MCPEVQSVGGFKMLEGRKKRMNTFFGRSHQKPYNNNVLSYSRADQDYDSDRDMETAIGIADLHVRKY